jgi:hypothetical protein
VAKVEQIEGIGPAYAAKLQDVGVNEAKTLERAVHH